MNNDPVERIRQWARQTIAFAVSVENAPKTGVPGEVLEQASITSHRVADRLLDESISACGGRKVEVVLVELVNRLFDWVAERRKSTQS